MLSGCCYFHRGTYLDLTHWFYIVTILAFDRMINLKVTLASLEIFDFHFGIEYYIITI
jgi:hypothetical protein